MESVLLARSVYRDDGNYVCTINGSFKVGLAVSYDLVKGTNENLQVKNPGLTFNQALEEAGDKTIAYTLSLTAGGYYHFDTEYTQAKKLSK